MTILRISNGIILLICMYEYLVAKFLSLSILLQYLFSLRLDSILFLHLYQLKYC